jgi:transcriptional antiterminator RfaH
MTQKASWFLIHTNPRQEERTSSNLLAWNIETFAPQIREYKTNQFTGERCFVVKPLFARYIFARFYLEDKFHKVRYTRGVRDLVSFGDGPVAVDDEIIELIRSRVGKDGFVKIGTDLKPGDVVVVQDGAMKNFTGIFERELKDSDRVVVLLNTINFQARLQIDRKMLSKLSDSVCAA